MTALPPILLLFDLSALLSGKTRDWENFSRLGECFVPRVVLEEIEFLCQRASEAETEQTAREFSRFYPESGWHSALSIASHSALKPTEGHQQSHKARLSLSVAQTAYGMSRNRPDALIVLVTQDQNQLQRLRIIDAPNLCGLTLAAFLQWSRTLRRPAPLTQQLQVMRSEKSALAAPTAIPSLRAAPRAMTAARAARSTTSLRPTPTPIRRPPARRSSPRSSLRLGQIFFNLLTLSLVAIGGLFVWQLITPTSFNTFWQQLPISQQ